MTRLCAVCGKPLADHIMLTLRHCAMQDQVRHLQSLERLGEERERIALEGRLLLTRENAVFTEIARRK